ncbi:hypothetical protein [Thiobacillus sp.]
MRLFIIAGVVLLVGCAQMVWVNPNKSESDFYSDKYKCEREAASTYPTATVNVPYTTGYQQPAMTNCSGDGNGNMSCMTTPGSYTPPATVLVDANKNNRNEAFRSCMYSEGWSLQEKSQVQDRVIETPQSLDRTPAIEPTTTLKLQWVQRLALLNGCSGDKNVKLSQTVGKREIYTVSCGNFKTMDVTCEFKGGVKVDPVGLPSVAGEPACWR